MSGIGRFEGRYDEEALAAALCADLRTAGPGEAGCCTCGGAIAGGCPDAAPSSPGGITGGVAATLHACARRDHLPTVAAKAADCSKAPTTSGHTAESADHATGSLTTSGTRAQAYPAEDSDYVAPSPFHTDDGSGAPAADGL